MLTILLQIKKSEGKDKMRTKIRNKSWADDQSFEEALRNYNRQDLQRKEILSFMVHDFGEYAWSLHEIPNQKIPTWNIPIHFINCVSSLFLHLILLP